MTTKKKALLLGLVVGGLLTALATVSNSALASGNQSDTTPGSGSRAGSTIGSGSTGAPTDTSGSIDTSVIATGPSDTTPPTSQGSGNSSDYPPGFDVVVERINTSGAPDAVKERILDRIEILKENAIASPLSLGALGALLGRTVSESPLRDQIRDQLRLRIQDFDRLMQSGDVDGAREEVRQIVSRYRNEMMILVQERVHTRLDGIIARLPELAAKIDTEAWRETLSGLRNDVLEATDLAELRQVVVEVRAALGDLRREIKGS
ncbi:MAG: hypothetical protein FGM29_10050 [Actinobacteria bacterium]|nr:hypothetical protein [Actinomycetota bacterium]